MKSILLIVCLLVSSCASCPPTPGKVRINPPLLMSFSIDEITKAPPSMTQKVADYVVEVVQYIRKVNALPCVEPTEKGSVK